METQAAGEAPRDLTVVYRVTRNEEVEAVLDLLRGNDLLPVALEDASLDSTMEYVSGWTYSVRIAVPRGQVERARAILREREVRHQSEVTGQARLLRKQALSSLAIALLSVPVLWWIFHNTGALALAMLVWFVAFIVIATKAKPRA